MERFSHPRPTTSWLGAHHRLHRLLRRQPALLPVGAPLLLAVSGGQDSMALVALLQALQPRHHWRLLLWHGDHRWRAESTAQALALAAWAGSRGLPLLLDGWQRPAGQPPSEAAARHWRYHCLAARAQQLGCSHVVTGHTASDRAETLLLNLARGSHRRGLAALPRERPLAAGITLVRPLLHCSRSDTGRLCQALQLPVWPDASNADPRYSRNRLRLEVMPVLEALHPGADRRLARVAEQLQAAEAASAELLNLALAPLAAPAPAGVSGPALQRPGLAALARANQEQLLQAWLERHTGRRWPSRSLEAPLDALGAPERCGGAALGDGWRLCWQGRTLWLQRDDALSSP